MELCSFVNIRNKYITPVRVANISCGLIILKTYFMETMTGILGEKMDENKISRIINLLEDILRKVGIIYEIFTSEPVLRRYLEYRRGGRSIVIVPSRQLEEISLKSEEILEKLTSASKNINYIRTQVDLTLKGVHSDPNCGGNLEIAIENSNRDIAMLCLKNPSHKWLIHGVQIGPHP